MSSISNFSFNISKRVHYSWRGDRCSKEAIESHFEFMRVPENATFLSQVVLGTSSIAGHGLVVNNWRDSTGETHTSQGKTTACVF